MPPSIQTSICEPTASAIAGKALIDDGAPSSWRPPWFETTIASAPLATASFASSTSRMPFRMSFPPQRFFTHSTSAQLRVGSNCCAVQAKSDAGSPTLSTWPTMLPKLRRLVPSMARHQRGLVIRLTMLARVGLGGAVRPFFRSLWRWPRICRSSVSTSALHLAARARSNSRSMKARSRSMYGWNQNGALVLAAMSSIEQMLIMLSVKGMPNFSAARAARISPSACCMPVRPVGAIATGIAAGMPTIVVASVRLSMSTATRWRSLMRWKSLSLAR